MFSYYKPPQSPDFPTMKSVEVKVPMSAAQVQVYKAWESRNLTPAMVRMLANPKTALDVTKMPQFRAYLDGGRRICNVVDDAVVSAPKFEEMIQRLAKTPGKALVFSHYLNKGIDVAESLFKKHGISFVTFTGREPPSKKKDAVLAYNADRVRVFLLSSAGGLGLDLHDTVTVHIMDPSWNESDILQAIYRAVRYKSHRTPNAVVIVYRYYCYKPYSSTTLSADMYLQKVSVTKEEINQKFLSYAMQHAMETQDLGSCTINEL
jgi:SNF2 family DNA or RNA helicase